MCGVVNVTHVERRGHDQVGSGWQDSAFDASMLEYMCTYVYMCVCIHGRVSGLGRNDGNPLGDWLVTSYQLREEREFSCDSDGLSIGIGSNVVVSRQALLKQWRLIESVASVQGAWTSPFFLDRASNLVAHVSRSEEDHRLFRWFWMDLEPTMSRLLLQPFLLLSVDTPSRHLSTDDFHSAIYWPPDTLVYYSYCERWHYSMAFRNLWQCGGDIKELLSATRNGTRLLHGPFSFVRGKWMVPLKKNTRLILILRGEDRD